MAFILITKLFDFCAQNYNKETQRMICKFLDVFISGVTETCQPPLTWLTWNDYWMRALRCLRAYFLVSISYRLTYHILIVIDIIILNRRIDYYNKSEYEFRKIYPSFTDLLVWQIVSFHFIISVLSWAWIQLPFYQSRHKAAQTFKYSCESVDVQDWSIYQAVELVWLPGESNGWFIF